MDLTSSAHATAVTAAGNVMMNTAISGQNKPVCLQSLVPLITAAVLMRALDSSAPPPRELAFPALEVDWVQRLAWKGREEI